MAELEALKRQRTTIKSRATRFKTYIDSYVDSLQERFILESKLEKYNESWQEYHTVQTKIDALLPEPDIPQREGFEEAFFIVQAKARSILARSRTNETNVQGNLQNQNTGQNVLNLNANQTLVRLPVISLPTFNGSYEQWQQFYDTFKALVDNNTNLDAVQKIHYLKSALSGTAAQKNLRVLQQLKEPTDKWDTLIVYLITSKLDTTTKKEWELKVINERLCTTNQLIEFLNARCEFLEALHPGPSKATFAKISTQKSSQINTNKNQNVSLSHAVTNEVNECVLCKQAHRIHACKIFKDLSVESRRNEAKRLSLCYNCLSSNHTVQRCSSRTCKHCSKKHHTLLHINERSSVNQGSTLSGNVSAISNDTNVNTQTSENPTPTSVSMKAINLKYNSEILLFAIVYIRDNSGNYHKVRALLDNGSQSSFISKAMCQQLGLKIDTAKHTISCLNVIETQAVESTRALIASTTTSYEADINFLIVKQITRSIPSRPIDVKLLSIPHQFELADPTFHKPQNVDLLLGASIFWDVLEADRIQLGARQPILQSTKLGWLLCGQIGSSLNIKTRNNHIVCGLVRNDELQAQIEKFWIIEEISNTKLLSKEEIDCERIFREEYQRTTDGRFQVSLFFRKDPSILGESESSAFKRLRSMERRFQRDIILQTRYAEFMKEYVELGHMSVVDNPGSMKLNYLPHHAVIKETSTSTRLRVVFDASSPTTSGRSLNDCLLIGPTIQSELFDILIRFRQYPYVLTGDIVKMYRQIMVKPEHRQYQCILWRESSDQPTTTFKLNTVTYGTAAAPFLAIRCLQQLAYDFEGTHPRAATVIAHDFYVDDMITGESSVQELLQTKVQVTDILKTAGFQLTKFYSNASLSQDEHQGDYGLTNTRILGLLWQPYSDLLRYQANERMVPEIISKRTILSLITQIFDPLGLIGPIIITAKILLQSLWQLKMDWDTPVPETFRMTWSSYYQQLHLINQMTIPRHAIIHNPNDIQLHGFCDASQTAYGACIYIRSVDQSGLISVQLLTAKSRVASLKTISLPRLELCGAVLLAKLGQRVAQALSCTITRRNFWTDSEIMLAWIQGEPSKWQTFVGNRIAEIQRLSNKQDWYHVRSEHNLADVISRGLLPEQLLRATLWWEGPSWLKKDPSQWPQKSTHSTMEVPEVCIQSFATIQVQEADDILIRYSSLIKLKRIIALCMRFKDNCMLSKAKKSKIHGPISCEELRKAMIIVVKLHQQKVFAFELHALQRGKAIDSHSKLLSFNPIIDQDGILRVGGRLTNAPIPYTQKHPILLSPNNVLTDLIIRDQHLRHFHIGPQLLLTTLRETYWIIHARNAIKRVLSKCVLCFRLRPRSPVQKMGDLPACRVTPSRVFNHTGVDYAGPFNIKISRNKSGKAYLCLFVCMTTKAVHLELVSDLTTEMFLNALKRFISRRGKCETIMSDNGKNFLGASNTLRQMSKLLSDTEHQLRTIEFAATQGITWRFIPPHSPHMGGLWEANVKAVKTHLKTVINETLLSFEELYTVLTQVEAILNSRPLCPLNNSPDDLEVLTPGHFLIGTSLHALPEESVLNIPLNRTNRYQLLTQLQQSFWKRWSREYITQLQQRTKWKNTVRNDEIQIGKLVLIRDNNLPPLKWGIGRICELHPSSDGLIRVVSLKTAGQIIQRSLPKICVLPID
ncbi:uncharacterized protein [Linepithema humile]|uniref:uncharacterized protein n=1 Tax=Linepithema humile TaxID=83485 RepID=UPI0006235007|nr:PREDICTED: uncharacterized protein LOC105679242 [Linepithema humile]